MKTKIKIINGNQIGGCITVISADKTKILIDFGESLPDIESDEKIDFDWRSEGINAVFFTHYHGDHIGRIDEIPNHIPIYMGETTYRVLLNINERIHKTKEPNLLKNRPNINFIEPKTAVLIDDIKITAYSVDHSAFDAYMFLVFANNEYILHTGDYRDHGHKGHIKKNGKDRNVLLDVIKYYVTDRGRRPINALVTEVGILLLRP
jgi:ribonuclease J